MSNNASFYTQPLERFFLARRRTNVDPSLPEAILKIATAVAEWQGCSPLNYEASQKKYVEMSETGITDYLIQLEEIQQGYFVLYNHPQTPQASLFIHTGESNTDQEFYFFLPNDTNSELLRIDRFMSLVAQLCKDFCATNGNVYDNYLGRLFGYQKRSYERQISEVPPEERSSYPKPYQIRGVEDTLPELLIMDEFDYHAVPNLIWWVNFWNHKMVQTVGIKRIHNAPWARQLELPDGSMVLAATESPTDVYNPEHLERLGQIVQALNLRELQEVHRVT